ncbi:hypothetical protein BT96DRAFT_1001558 [Gymnopus androsaceus JB14]|uniref:Uncharacterized protein n=1 Tax=Gymnopus androsaceus JB14 TaxID=1447944 RepID=A0A6A4GZ37_9AGAR|nr:hypothetical protein BT96DRAFT_1001558 [Gymnopus androsaceus JB14]
MSFTVGFRSLQNHKIYSPHALSAEVVETCAGSQALLSEGLAEQEAAFQTTDTDEVVPLKAYALPPQPSRQLAFFPLSLLASLPPLPPPALKQAWLATLEAHPAPNPKHRRYLKKMAKYREARGVARHDGQVAAGTATKAHAHKHIEAARSSAAVIPAGRWSGPSSPYSPKVYSSTEVLSLSGFTLVKANRKSRVVRSPEGHVVGAHYAGLDSPEWA